MLRSSLMSWNISWLSYSQHRFLSSAAAEISIDQPKKRKREKKIEPVILKNN